jgi:hypothetical protein
MRNTAAAQARRVAEKMGIQVSDEQLAEAAAGVSGVVPPAYNRQQRRAAASRARRRA